MIYNLCYNEDSYLSYIKGVEEMTLEHILQTYNYTVHNKRYNLSKDTKEYIHYIEKDCFFISPTLSAVQNGLQNDKVKLIIISAPGAVGKTTLAKHFSFTVGALYWDLAKMTVGTGTFQGTLLKAVGLSNISKFMQDLVESKVVFAFDAFDEAEMISGRRMLVEFISDISNEVCESSTPSAVLLLGPQLHSF